MIATCVSAMPRPAQRAVPCIRTGPPPSIAVTWSSRMSPSSSTSVPAMAVSGCRITPRRSVPFRTAMEPVGRGASRAPRTATSTSASPVSTPSSRNGDTVRRSRVPRPVTSIVFAKRSAEPSATNTPPRARISSGSKSTRPAARRATSGVTSMARSCTVTSVAASRTSPWASRQVVSVPSSRASPVRSARTRDGRSGFTISSSVAACTPVSVAFRSASPPGATPMESAVAGESERAHGDATLDVERSRRRWWRAGRGSAPRRR